jgi:hypothetical protein
MEVFTRKVRYMGPSPATETRDATDVSIDTTAAETTLFSFSIGAGKLDGDQGIRCTIFGAWKNDSGGSVVTTIRVKLGSTTVWQDNFTAADATPEAPFFIGLDVRGKNSDAIQDIDGVICIGNRTLPAVGTGDLSGGLDADAVIHGEAAEDATDVLDFSVTIDMDTSHADAWWLHRKSHVEVI